MVVVLHNIRGAHNVGAIFRTAGAIDVSHIYLSGYTPTPLDRFGRARSDIAKTALGTEGKVPWSYAPRAGDLLRALHEHDWHLVAVEQAENAISYRMFHLRKQTCFIFGNELRGLSSSVLGRCDTVIEIPTHAGKSLNVSVAAGVVLFNATQ